MNNLNQINHSIKSFFVILTLSTVTLTNSLTQASVNQCVNMFSKKSPDAISKKLTTPNVKEVNKKSLKISDGRYVYFEHFIGETDKPTLVILPGITRNYAQDSADIEFTTHLKKLGYSYIAITLSQQAMSLGEIPKNEVPYAQKVNSEPLHMSDFADEVELVIDHLNISKYVAISLSYSAALIPYLDSSKFIKAIHIAPFAKASDDIESIFPNLSSSLFSDQQTPLQTFFQRYSLDQFYKTFWSYIYETRKNQHDLMGKNSASQSTLIKAGSMISEAIEEEDIGHLFTSEQKQYFILAHKDKKARLKHQLDNINWRLKNNLPTETYMVDSTHNIFQEKPNELLVILQFILEQK